MTLHTTDCASQRINRAAQPVDQLPCDCADLGLNVDIIDVDFLRRLARELASVPLADLADRLALEIADVGRLRGL